MSDYGYSPSCSPTYIREKATLWVDVWETDKFNPKMYIPHASKNIEESTSSKIINKDEKDKYIQQLEEKIVNQQKQINKQEGTIKQLTDVYCEMNTTLTRLWNKSFNINMATTREEIKEILNIWYQKEWMSVL